MATTKNRQAIELAAKTGYDVRTARRWLDGEKVAESTRRHFELVAPELGIEPPAAPVEAAS